MKSELKQKARESRGMGQSFGEISKTLCVAKSTVREWTKDIALSEVQKKELSSRSISNLYFTGRVEGAKSKRRLDMGEEAWQEYQKDREAKKFKIYRLRRAEYFVNYKSDLKRELIAHKGGKCEICGYNKDCPSAFHFHHKNPSEKDFTISGLKRSYKLAFIEIEKCQLVCANCHAEIHDLLYAKQKEETIKKMKNLASYLSGKRESLQNS